MQMFDDVSPVFWAVTILIAASAFTFFWGLDALTHKKLVKVDITDSELQTHRNILVASMLMEISLVSAYWIGVAALPFFIALFITRLVHEFIDELHFHTKRCTPYESYLHLAMWITVLIKTFVMLIWGVFYQYTGVLELHPVYYVWGIVLFCIMSYISWKEWQR